MFSGLALNPLAVVQYLMALLTDFLIYIYIYIEKTACAYIYFSLKRLGHEIIIRFKWFGLIGLGLEKVRQIFLIFLTVAFILN
jgi:hypothetical protein